MSSSHPILFVYNATTDHQLHPSAVLPPGYAPDLWAQSQSNPYADNLATNVPTVPPLPDDEDDDLEEPAGMDEDNLGMYSPLNHQILPIRGDNSVTLSTNTNSNGSGPVP